jgi:hypothetical protein
MSATVTTGKAVLGFTTKNNNVIYVLAEETYEKNCRPHTPRWGVFAVGTYKEVMKKVFGRASSAEGGTLQNRANNLTPETYLRGWNLAFGKPIRFDNRNVTLEILPRGYWRDGFESESALAIFQKLKEINRLDIWETLISDDGKVIANIYEDSELITALFGVNGVDQPWKIIGFSDYDKANGVIDESLIPAKKNGGVMPATMPRLAKLTTSYQTVGFIQLQSDGSFANFQHDYFVMGEYIRNQAYECEMIEKGLGISNISQYREILNSEPDIASDLDAFISKSTVTEKLVGQFEYNVGIKFEDADDEHKLPSALFAIERVSSLIKVYFKRKPDAVVTKDENLQLAA